ncbi:MAG TPA: ATP-binding protein [Thermoanaerobaculia bacterium]|nr:ATP-binding protein [Thermoanaerobaculia bacterium]
MTEPQERIASPASSGGAGPCFEQHVDAHWLALLLVNAIPPIALDSTISKISFQTEHLGWSTDDVLVTSRTSASETRQLACQVKTTLTIGAGNEEFSATIVDAWKDFSSATVFRENVDAIAIVTQLGTNVVLRDFAGLLECARASSTAADFEHRSTTPGFVNAQVRTHAGVVEEILKAHEGGAVDRERIWRFLRHLYVLSLDLNTATSQTAAHVLTLLAHTATETDRIAAAAATWNELLANVSRGAPKAREYERTALPASILARHAPLSTADRRALDRLANHSHVILDGISTTIGDDLHLPRTKVLTQLLEQMERSRVLLVAGAAGSGKSAIVKEAVELLARDHFVFAFRAEELAQPHFATTLTAIGVALSAEELSGVFAGQPRKVLVVESVERLLEASSRDAFTDLLRFVRKDPTWRLILTCRDYSIELLRAAFLDAAATPHDTLHIPPLADDEIEDVGNHAPILRRLLKNDRLRRLLRNPYILNIAVRTPWREEDHLPESEREFRGHFWRSSVRAEDRREGGLPQRRADAFMQICARRAQALRLFAPISGLDAEAVNALENDSLVVMSPENRALVAPAHDVLEDWGVLEWIEHLYQQANESVEDFARSLGDCPAVRRTYRTWISELLERDPSSADAFFDSVVRDEALPQHFSDDTIIAFLRSTHAAALLIRHASRLVANDKRLLRRIVHLLRVGCVTLPAWIPFATASSILSHPEGEAWPTVLAVVRDHLSLFDDRDRQLLLGLVEDWAKGVNWQVPYPAGQEAAAAITLWLIPRCGGHQSEDLLKRSLKVLVKIPASDPTAFASVFRGQADDERDRTAEELQEIVFDGMDGFAVARDLPDLVAEVGKAYLLATPEDLDDRYGYSPGIELFFGIKASRGHGHLPPSAWRGPFRTLLQHHWKTGRDFIVALLNYSAEWYGKRLGPDRGIEPAFEITLTFADGTTKTQWANARLWQLYRGTSGTPYPLQSAAMALEAFLFEVAKQDVNLLDPVLLQLLRASTTVAVTAVVASLAVAHPRACGETLLVLLSSSACIRLDRARMATDRMGGSPYPRLPQHDPLNEIFAKERAEADAQQHRQQDLETAITLLQASPYAARVCEAIDKHRTAIPLVEEQTEEDRLWRLALHRMDLRNYEPVPAEETPTIKENVPANYVLFTPTTPEADLQEMVEESSNRHARVSERIGNQMWGIKVFERESGTYDPDEWRSRLAAVRAGEAAGDAPADEMFFGDGAAVTSAVCVRDHWDEMNGEERAWCTRRVCDEIIRTADDWSETPQMLGLMNGAVPAASVIPQIVIQTDTAGRAAALTALAAALTHPNREVHLAAARASRVLWDEHRDIALQCVHGLRVQAMTLQRSFDAEQAKPYRKRADTGKLRSKAASVGRKIIRGRRPISADDVSAFTVDGWFTADASIAILIMLSNALTERTTIDALAQVATTLVAWWEADRHHRSNHENHSYETEYTLKELLAEGLFRVAETDAAQIVHPLLDAVDTHADKVADVLHDIIIREDRNHSTARFWFLWKLFADRVRAARWLPNIDSEYAWGRQLLDWVFLSRGWKDGTRHWPTLEGYAHNVHTLFEQLPLSRAALRRHLLFLYHVGEQSLPEAFIRLHAKMRNGNAPELLAEGDSAYALESLLLRYVYAKPFELKRRSDMRAAVLFLLDALVETGSSAAFRMRDDFVTPLSATSQQNDQAQAGTG